MILGRQVQALVRGRWQRAEMVCEHRGGMVVFVVDTQEYHWTSLFKHIRELPENEV